MAETMRIEIPIETVDNTDPELTQITKKLNNMEKAADSAASSTKKPRKQYPNSINPRRKRRSHLQHGQKKNIRYCLKQKTR